MSNPSDPTWIQVNMEDETQKPIKGQQSVEAQPHLPSHPAAENLPRDSMMIPVPKGEDDPSSDDMDTEEKETIVAMMPHQWQKCYRSYKNFNELCHHGGFLQYGGCTNVVKGIVAQWKAIRRTHRYTARCWSQDCGPQSNKAGTKSQYNTHATPHLCPRGFL